MTLTMTVPHVRIVGRWTSPRWNVDFYAADATVDKNGGSGGGGGGSSVVRSASRRSDPFASLTFPGPAYDFLYDYTSSARGFDETESCVTYDDIRTAVLDAGFRPYETPRLKPRHRFSR
jgi:hypothetical protein